VYIISALAQVVAPGDAVNVGAGNAFTVEVEDAAVAPVHPLD
jgi:hypothetical protein